MIKIKILSKNLCKDTIFFACVQIFCPLHPTHNKRHPMQSMICLFIHNVILVVKCTNGAVSKVQQAPIGYPKVNQDFICLLLGKRRYMSPSIPQLLPHRVPKSKPRLRLFAFGKAEVRVASTMTRSSVCATSLPNAYRTRRL